MLRSLTFASSAATLLLGVGFGMFGGRRKFNSAHIHPTAIAIRAVSFTLITFLKVLHALYVVQIGKIFIPHLQTFLISEVICQDFT